MIEDPIHTTSAHLVWQSPIDGTGSRAHLSVAKLQQEANGEVSFRYLTESPDFAQAWAEGFRGYTGIPLDRTDTSDAVSTLARRILSPDRPDYAEYLRRFGLKVEHNLPTLSLLAYTGARLTSDSFCVRETFEGFDRPFQYIFDVAGRRHYAEATPSPKVGDRVFFHPDPDNQYDSNAVMLCDDRGEPFGYIDRNQSAQVSQWLLNGSVQGAIFRVNGTKNHPRLFVSADIVPNLS